MNNSVDYEYQELIRRIFNNGVWKDTRSGKVISTFGHMIRLDMSDGFPLLTTKKMFFKGIKHELLWFLRGEQNIRYLVENGVSIWNDDAYRWFQHGMPYADTWSTDNETVFIGGKTSGLNKFANIRQLANTYTEDDFINLVKDGAVIFKCGRNGEPMTVGYRFGDIGPVYGTQWRKWGCNAKYDQMKRIIDTLRTNPNDRRMIMTAWNVSMLDEMALPPCHYACQFYTRPLSETERSESNKVNGIAPKYGLSLMWNQRSVDVALGLPFNIASYALLLHLVAQCVSMKPLELIGSLGDCHIYENHLDGIHEQLKRDPYRYELPKLSLNPYITDIDKFTADDITIDSYESYGAVKYKLSVG